MITFVSTTVPINMLSRILLFFPLMIIYQLSHSQVTDSTGQIAATGFITIKITCVNPEKLMQDALQWQQQKILLHNYAGKRVKQILLQQATGRVEIFLSGNYGISLTKAEAVRIGFFADGTMKAASPVHHTSYIPDIPKDIYADSPLYVGIKNNVLLKYAADEDSISSSGDTEIQPAGTTGQYIVQTNTPGYITMVAEDKNSKKQKYIYHFLAKRLPQDDLAVLPEVQLGNIKTMAVKKSLLIAQTEMRVAMSYSFVSARAYFTGPCFQQVIVTSADEKLTYVKCYLDMCTPGSSISFDNIIIKDKAGKLFNVPALLIKVIDDTAADNEPVNYFESSSAPQFPGGDDMLKWHVQEELNKTNGSDIKPGEYSVGIVIKIDDQGNVSMPCINEEERMTPIQKKCYNIIKSGPQWSPGKFGGNNTAMIVGVAVKVSLK